MLKRLQFVGIMLFLLCITGTAYAIPSQGSSKSQVTQGEGTCSGVVTDATGETVIGASVVIKGTLTGTITDLDGAFSLANVPYGSTIVISFIGSVTQEVVWTGGAFERHS